MGRSAVAQRGPPNPSLRAPVRPAPLQSLRRCAVARAPQVLAPLCFGDEILELRVERTAGGDDSHKLAVLGDRKVPKTVAAHDEQRMPEALGRIDGEWRRRHRVADARLSRIKIARHDAENDVSLGEDAYQALILDERDRADVSLRHPPCGLGD